MILTLICQDGKRFAEAWRRVCIDQFTMRVTPSLSFEEDSVNICTFKRKESSSTYVKI